MSANFTTQHGDYRLSVMVTAPPWYENCYVVQHTPSGEMVVIDPGSDPERILSAIETLGGSVREILLTHGHPDHLGAVRPLQDKLGVACRVHGNEAPLLADIVHYARTRLGLDIEAPLSIEAFADDTAFELGGVPFQMIPTPGHTQGGVVYHFGSFAMTGDTLFNHGVGRTDLPGGNGPQLVASISRLLDGLPNNCQLYCGHGPSWTVAEARPWWTAMRGWDSTL